jgi:hypothetical protein
MLARSLLFAGLLLVGGCAYDAGYYESNYASEAASTTGYYSPVDYSTPYRPSSPVYGAPYVDGPVMGGVYVYGDETDSYGGPVFSPFHGISCDRRRQVCWGRNGPDPRWTSRFFGHRHADWNNGNWHSENGNHGNSHHGGWNNSGGNGHRGGPNPGSNNSNNNQPWVYQVPQDPDGSGKPTFLPNGN